MNPKLQRRLDKLDIKLAALLKKLQKYSDEDLNWKPSEGEWSVMQVLQHLMLAEGYAVQYIQKKLSFTPELKKAGVMTSFRSFLVKVSLRYPFKIKAPDAVNEQLPDHSSFWDVAKQWKQQRIELKSYLDGLPEDTLNRELYKHPAVGKLSAKGMFSFFDLHFDRHQKQINRILKNYRY